MPLVSGTTAQVGNAQVGKRTALTSPIPPMFAPIPRNIVTLSTSTSRVQPAGGICSAVGQPCFMTIESSPFSIKTSWMCTSREPQPGSTGGKPASLAVSTWTQAQRRGCSHSRRCSLRQHKRSISQTTSLWDATDQCERAYVARREPRGSNRVSAGLPRSCHSSQRRPP